MSSRTASFIVHPALGGLDATTAATVLGLIKPDALTIAENVAYDASGIRKKRPGTSRYNASAISGSPTITALRDFWRYGSSRTPTQKFVGAAGTVIVKDDGDGVWDTLKSSWGSGTSVACITIGEGKAIISTANGTDAPQYWDGSAGSTSDLGGSPPTFAFSSYHQRRLWAAGAAANMSRISYSAGGDVQTWSGGDSATLILDEDDGDAIVGLSKTFRRRLYAFKGPSVGSVWEITGTTVNDYTRNKIVEGAPCVGHNTIVTTANDIFWLSTAGVHSLLTTEKFGDTEERFISRPIDALFKQLNISRLGQAYGTWHPRDKYVAWAVPESGSTVNNIVMIFYYLTDQWAVWRFGGFNAACIQVMRNPASSGKEPRLYVGGYDGFVREGDKTTLADDNADTAYTGKIRTPIFTRFPNADEMTEKSISGIRTFFRPANGTATLDVVCDDRLTSKTVDMTGNGANWDEVNWDEFEWGGNNLEFVDTPLDERCTSIELTYYNATANEGMEIVGYAVRYAPAEAHAMDRA